MGVIPQTVTAQEGVGTTGLVQATVWDAGFERWLLDDPNRMFHPEQHQRYVRRICPWTSNKIVANSVAGFGNGLNLLRDWIAAQVPPPPTHVAWGTNGTAPDVEDKQLYDEKVRTEIIARVPGNKEVTLAGFMSPTTGNGFDYREAALVTGPLGTQWRIFARVAINSIAKNSNVIISILWRVILT